jgi:hypothetical protein
MKRNEIFIIGGAILAAILLFKGQATSSVSGSIPFINPFSNLLGKAEAQALQTLGSNIETLQSVKQSNLGIAQSILDLERSTADVKISQQQTELDKVQSYIGSQQKFAASAQFPKISPDGFTAKGLLSRFDSSFNYFRERWTGEKGPLSQVSIFPDFNLPLNPSNRSIIQQQAQYETAQGNIAKASEFAIRQQGEIDRLNEEYQTRFGGLSRYG